MGKWIFSNAAWDAFIEVTRHWWDGEMTAIQAVNLLSWIVPAIFAVYGMYTFLRRVVGCCLKALSDSGVGNRQSARSC